MFIDLFFNIGVRDQDNNFEKIENKNDKIIQNKYKLINKIDNDIII